MASLRPSAAILAEVPTLAEQGYPNTEASNWYALQTQSHCQVRQKLIQSGAIPVGGTAQELGTFLKTEYEKWGRVVAAHHITEAP